jgi:DNA-binding response OmpR family regulator
METQNKKRIIYVEDNLSIFDSSCRYLSITGHKYDIKHATTLDETISMSENENFEVYITDGEFPSSTCSGANSGLEYCKYLKSKHNGQAKILFASSHCNEPEFIKKVKSIDDKIICIAKPYDMGEFTKIVEKLSQ